MDSNTKIRLIVYTILGLWLIIIAVYNYGKIVDLNVREELGYKPVFIRERTLEPVMLRTVYRVDESPYHGCPPSVLDALKENLRRDAMFKLLDSVKPYVMIRNVSTLPGDPMKTYELRLIINTSTHVK